MSDFPANEARQLLSQIARAFPVIHSPDDCMRPEVRDYLRDYIEEYLTAHVAEMPSLKSWMQEEARTADECPACSLSRDAGYGSNGCERCGYGE